MTAALIELAMARHVARRRDSLTTHLRAHINETLNYDDEGVNTASAMLPVRPKATPLHARRPAPQDEPPARLSRCHHYPMVML